MIIEKIDPGRECFNDFIPDGYNLTIGGVGIDLASEEGDQEKIITLGSCDGIVHRGLSSRCTYVADIIIPPRKYQSVEADDSNEETEGNAPESIALPLDTETVKLRLWPVVDEVESETNQTMEENYGAE